MAMAIVGCWLKVRCEHLVVGNSSRNLPQLPTFESQTAGSFTWQQMHVVEFDAPVRHSRAPALFRVRPTVVTGFSANHLSAGMLLLRSIAKAAADASGTRPGFEVSVVVWAMDEFGGKDKEDLECVVREMKATSGVEVEVRRFKFWAFPEWMRIKQRHETGSFNENGTGEWNFVFLDVLVRVIMVCLVC